MKSFALCAAVIVICVSCKLPKDSKLSDNAVGQNGAALQCTTLGRMQRYLNAPLPNSTKEWQDFMYKGSGTEFVPTALVPFSLAPTPATLCTPRILMSLVPAVGGYVARGIPFRTDNRLWVGANAHGDRYDTMEFITWDYRAKKYLFGEKSLQGDVRLFANGDSCFKCHQAALPVIQLASWSNTTTNAAIARAMLSQCPSWDPDKTFETRVQKMRADFPDRCSDKLKKDLKRYPIVANVEGIAINMPDVGSKTKALINNIFDFDIRGLRRPEMQGKAAICEFINKIPAESVKIKWKDTLLKHAISLWLLKRSSVVKDYNGLLSSALPVPLTSVQSASSFLLPDFNPLTGRISTDVTAIGADESDFDACSDEMAAKAKAISGKENAVPDQVNPKNPAAFLPQSALNEEKFRALLTPNANGIDVLIDLMGIIDSDQQLLIDYLNTFKTSQSIDERLQTVLNSPRIAQLYASSCMPSRDDLLLAIAEMGANQYGTDGATFLQQAAVETGPLACTTDVVSPDIISHKGVTVCGDCHLRDNAIDFDYGDIPAWEKRKFAGLNMTVIRNKVLDRLTTTDVHRVMPPQEEASRFTIEQRDKLMSYLKALPNQ